MIVELILDWLEAALMWLTGLFPTTSPDLFGDIGGIAGHLGDLNYFLPIQETFTLVVGVLVIFPVFMGVSLALWVGAQIRGSSSVG